MNLAAMTSQSFLQGLGAAVSPYLDTAAGVGMRAFSLVLQSEPSTDLKTGCGEKDTSCHFAGTIDAFAASERTTFEETGLEAVIGETAAQATSVTKGIEKATGRIARGGSRRTGESTGVLSLSPKLSLVGKGSAISREIVRGDEVRPGEGAISSDIDPHSNVGVGSRIPVEPHVDSVVTSATSTFSPAEVVPAIAASPEYSFNHPWTSTAAAASPSASPSIISNVDPAAGTADPASHAKGKITRGSKANSKASRRRVEIAYLARKAKAVYAAHVEAQHTAQIALKFGRKVSPFTNTSVIASIASANNPAQIGSPVTGSPRISVVPSANGTNHIVIDRLSSPGFLNAKVHLIEHSGGVEFAGIECGRSMAASDARSLPLPVPTFLPNGLTQNRAQHEGAPGREAPTDTFDSEESVSEFRERLASFMIEQLKEGPTPTATNRILKQLNAYLSFSPHLNSKRPVTPPMWSRMVRLALGEAVRTVPIFDREGLREGLSIKHDVAAILGMELPTFQRWENIFETDLLTDQLSDDDAVPAGESFESDLTGHLLSGLERRLPSLAKQTLESDYVDPSIGLEGEANLQWGIAVASSIGNPKREAEENKVEATLGYLKDVMKHNAAAAGKGMALILKHSDTIRNAMREEPFVPRWAEAEIRSLISSIMVSEIWELMAERSFRKHFDESPEINRFLNEAIFEANYSRAMDELGRIDVTKVSDKEFWGAVEKTGLAEVIFNDALMRMAKFN